MRTRKKSPFETLQDTLNECATNDRQLLPLFPSRVLKAKFTQRVSTLAAAVLSWVLSPEGEEGISFKQAAQLRQEYCQQLRLEPRDIIFPWEHDPAKYSLYIRDVNILGKHDIPLDILEARLASVREFTHGTRERLR